MKSKILPLGLIALGGALFISGTSSDVKAQDFSIATPIGSMEPYLQIRPRYEYVHVKNSTKDDANALTTRIKIGLKLNNLFQVNGFNGQLEAIDVSALIDDFNPEKSQYETVPDPANTRLTQAYISYKYNKTLFFFGRKYVTIDDHRFIGSVDWRQMPQSFGVVGLQDNTFQGLNILVAGIYEKKGILDTLNMDWKADKMPIVLDVSYQVFPSLRLKAFGYLITDIHDTYGIKADGKVTFQNGVKFSYLGEYAIQKDPYENDNYPQKPDIDTDYYRLAGNLSYNVENIGQFFGGLEYTYFGDKGSKDKGFSTPLATLHKFEGWSDVLLPGAKDGFDYGLQELKFSVGYKHPLYGKFTVAYLNFEADKDQPGVGDSIGSEWDFAYSKSFNKHFSLLLKGAIYNADNGYYSGGELKGVDDTTKYWVQVVVVF